MKIKKRYVIVALLFLLIIILIVTNPTKKSYLHFSEEEIGIPTPKSEEIEIKRVNFHIFSTYTPIVRSEYGITHLGVFNNFVKISEGQFDYPWWLEVFN